MFSCFNGQHKKLLPFRVRNRNGSKRCGFAAKSLSDLKTKVRNKFEVKVKDVSLVLEEDGTEVDDDEYLAMLPHNAVLVLLTDSEQWAGAEANLEEALAGLLRATHLPAAAEQIRAAMSSASSSLHLDLLGKMNATLSMEIPAETRDEHKEWFTDVAPKYKTKTCFMREKARVRVRGYLYHTKDYISKKSKTSRARRKLELVLDDFIAMLKKEDYFSDHFARTSTKKAVICDRKGSAKTAVMCDREGWFRCEGAFNVDDCQHPDHRINPYGSRDFRILFSTWDLDHGVEKSREVLPRMTDAANNKTKDLNVNYFFDLLFTRHNLRLVHPVCHDKSGHDSAKCQPDKMFL